MLAKYREFIRKFHCSLQHGCIIMTATVAFLYSNSPMVTLANLCCGFSFSPESLSETFLHCHLSRNLHLSILVNHLLLTESCGYKVKYKVVLRLQRIPISYHTNSKKPDWVKRA